MMMMMPADDGCDDDDDDYYDDKYDSLYLVSDTQQVQFYILLLYNMNIL